MLKNRLETESLSEEKIRNHLHTKKLGRKMQLLFETGSTNQDAKCLAARGAEEGTLVAANRQTAGRGRLGRSFFSPGEKGIYMSIILRPGLEAKKSTMITSMAAVAVARAIEQVSNAQAKIKWVNDVYVNGKKVCGILTEAAIEAENGMLSYAVLGIGVNVGSMEFPPELCEIATSIENETGEPVEREVLIAAILNETESLYATMATGDFLEESRKRSLLIGKEIRVLEGEDSYPAKAVEIDETGQLIVETGEGRKALHSGEVSVRL